MVTGIILAGGLGTRLAGTLPHLPKTLAPIQGIPFLKLLLDQLDKSQILSKVILALGVKAENVQQFLRSRSYGFTLETSVESSPLGTGGALLNALERASTETLLVLNGDSYFDLSLPDFLTFHQGKGADVTIDCKEMLDVSRYGSVEIEPSSQKICSFKEKCEQSESGWISAGLYLIQKDLLVSFQQGASSLEKDIFPHFLKNKIFAYAHVGSFIDIGTPNSYNDAQEILKPWTIASITPP
jgi:D-glycero-alpha-D-manno-heptose 1-phosphate guanylyltransferase